MRSLLLILLFLALGYLCDAQSTNANTETISNPKPKKAARGTYQFIAAENDTTSVFTDDILIIIESLRDKNKIVYYDASPTVQVKILPGAMITARDFHPVKEWINLKEE